MFVAMRCWMSYAVDWHVYVSSMYINLSVYEEDLYGKKSVLIASMVNVFQCCVTTCQGTHFLCHGHFYRTHGGLGCILLLHPLLLLLHSLLVLRYGACLARENSWMASHITGKGTRQGMWWGSTAMGL